MTRPTRRPAHRRRHPHRGDPEREARREARRAELLDAAVAVIRREGPGASMEQIAAEAGVTKPILYRHFGDRDGLLDALAANFEAEVTGALQEALSRQAGPRELLIAGIDTYLSIVERDPAVYQVLVRRSVSDRSGGPQAVIRRVGQQVAVVIGEQMRALGLDSGAAEPWAFGLVGMVHAAGDWWLERPTMPRHRLVEYLALLVWDGMSGVVASAGDRAGDSAGAAEEVMP